MGRTFRIKLRIRRFARRHPWLVFIVRSFMVFSATFGGAYGFIAGARTENSGYDPHTFAIGIAFLFALACVALAAMSFRFRMLRKKMRKIVLHNEAMADRNWELQEAEQRTRRLFEAQGDLIVLRDAEGRIVFANDAYCELAQTKREALIGSTAGLRVLEQGDTALEANGTRIHDQKIAGPLGPRWIAWREGLVRSDAGEAAELQCVGRDVTDRTESERALTEARDQADAASRAKSRFLAMASHEIRTPLNGIIGMSGLLMDTPLTPEQATYVKAVKTSGDALLSLIEELLDYSKIEAGKIDLEHRPFALSGMIEDIAELLAPRAQARKIEIAAYVDDRLPMEVIGDAARLRQVLLNLAGNAIKFTSSGGVALIVEPGIWPNEISFLVRDTGIGIAPEAQERIFREFEQADDRIARSYGGTGLGLSISDRIVKRMGGRITLESKPERGFHLRGLDSARDGRRRPEEFHGAGSLRPVDHAGFATGHRGLADRAAAAALGRADLHGGGHGRRAGAVAGTALARDPDRSCARNRRYRSAGRGRPASCRPAHRDVHAGDATGDATIREFRLHRLSGQAAARGLARRPPHRRARCRGARHCRRRAGRDAGCVSSHTGLSILVAEDNEINALLMRSLLGRLGHHAVIVTNGEEALESWLSATSAGSPYDLVLMDIQMPELNGIDATKRIRQLEAGQSGRRTPILALTANTLVEDRYACFESGMDGFLIKPLDRDKLAEALAGLAASRYIGA